MLQVDLFQDGRLLAHGVMKGKVFSTGSNGYRLGGKLDLDGKKYTVNFMLVEVGSKAKNKGSDGDDEP